MNQHQVLLIVIVVVVLVAIAIIASLLVKKRRTQTLRRRFGPEYDRVVRQEGDTRRAEEVLQFRTTRLEKLSIRPLSRPERTEFASRWAALQPQFVDNPENTVSRADELVSELMRARGYPVGDFEQRVADISVDHPIVVENYRAAHNIALRHNRGEASTEDLRRAMVHYRALFDDLLADSQPTRKEA